LSVSVVSLRMYPMEPSKLDSLIQMSSIVYNLINNFDIGTLHLLNENEIMTESLLIDLTNACETIHLYKSEKITAHALHLICKSIIDRSTKFST
ncbi:hypothetical protein PENTCL1PPCAC_5772, partial [Pristionchus entomophagus]